MSIRGAVSELNNEIQRLTEIRDSLLQAESGRGVRGSGLTATDGKSAVAKKTGTPKKAAPTRVGSAPKTKVIKRKSATKRVVSDATRKKMSDAAKARSAANKTIPGK